MVLYGIVGALFSYCVSLAVTSPLAAFAAVAGYQVIMFVVSVIVFLLGNFIHIIRQLYLSGYLLVLTYAKTSDAPSLLVIIHFTISLAAPVCSVVR